MTKKKIIALAESMGFHLDHDKWSTKNSNNGNWLRFCLPKELDEEDLRWIWYKDMTDQYNIENGKYIQDRGLRKQAIQEFLKY